MRVLVAIQRKHPQADACKIFAVILEGSADHPQQRMHHDDTNYDQHEVLKEGCHLYSMLSFPILSPLPFSSGVVDSNSSSWLVNAIYQKVDADDDEHVSMPEQEAVYV